MKSLKDWREGKGWNTQRLAEELGLDERSGAGTVWRWETGRSRPDADVVAKIAEITGGAVTAHDMHLTRLAFLQVKSPSAGVAA
ncbi:helix-turn-helix transcriptional regulator [Aurantimonas endophytica]|uniref:Transcriptional regulator with XRE-family HTH domain n=1 Tax=Aurantimonas endophytica TaxID=1522175 RepID=A0A7W6HFZ7_9HYPH|nr:helix-turn-helix transcriptional regulator [Aurantimonas endophytica]MBB4004448.1 transcriptional regulator with XRE-family HTH domain [Aurantimonas endophytica]MCO6405285.1 helix-turn-helix domain-containing protein [Aurantimonas endophytica]